MTVSTPRPQNMGIAVNGVYFPPTFEVGSDGSTNVLRPQRVSEFANRTYTRGHHPLTAEERLVLRVMKDININPWLAGMDVQGIANRNFSPN
jgi:hypothetical protein